MFNPPEMPCSSEQLNFTSEAYFFPKKQTDSTQKTQATFFFFSTEILIRKIGLDQFYKTFF